MRKKHFGDNEDNAEADKNGAGDLVDNAEGVQGQAAAELAGQQHLGDIGGHVDEQTNGKNNDPFLHGMAGREQGGICQPEKNHAGVECIDQETGCEDAGHIPFAEPGLFAGRIGSQVHFFEKDEINTHADQEAAATHGDRLGMCQELVDEGSEGIAEDHQDDVTDPDAGNEGKSALVPVVETLFDDSENDWPHR